ncbi:HNH endonuclease signature motif containing protein [Corynebacterium sp. Marseille-P4321]|uniref:HNH endonuclease signature motif containing protein n=1 Tax=Corynebacterium sp. Marseille-P4321 TaxID=2736603 RepID=UPI00158B96BF|nr:HNH endonuclease signature motif containing protein [Corynebacterium sp. Marseille-P4321]
MTGFDRYLKTGPTIDALDGFDRPTALAAGFDPAVATQWQKLHDTYYGEKRFAYKATEARRLAAQSAFSLDQLRLIERRIAHIKDRVARWNLRLELLAEPATYRQLETRIAKVVPEKKFHRTKSLRLTQSSNGLRSLFLTADERDLADLEHYLRQDIDTTKPAGPQMLRRFLKLIRKDGGGIAHAQPRPIVVVTLEQHMRIMASDGDEVVLGLSDGTTITGAEYLAMRPELSEVALFHPHEGAVNLYRSARYANDKQRTLAKMTHTVCPWPGCKHASEYCQVHHVTAYSQGGETNMSNLAMLCSYHNRINHDNPAHNNRRGGMQRVNGTTCWVSPNGTPVPNTTHPYGAAHILTNA